jgi:hypothetical protein
MKMEEAEDMKKERKEMFNIVTVGFKWRPLNFDFALTAFCAALGFKI